ncbi:MAG: RNA polymerase sigma factor [Actinomycetota bacterium]
MAEASPELIAFCEAQHPWLVGMLALYCGDRDIGEELAQETLARVCRDWGKVADLDSPEAWAHRVGINLAHSHFRRRAAERRVRKRLEAENRTHWFSGWPEDRIELLDAITSLPHRQRSALLLRYYAGMSVREVADALECPEGTAKTLIHRAVHSLRRAMNSEVKEESNVIRLE